MILLRYSGIPALDFTSVVDEDYGANDDTITVPSINIELDKVCWWILYKSHPIVVLIFTYKQLIYFPKLWICKLQLTYHDDTNYNNK